jgi:hypothetical protein
MRKGYRVLLIDLYDISIIYRYINDWVTQYWVRASGNPHNTSIYVHMLPGKGKTQSTDAKGRPGASTPYQMSKFCRQILISPCKGKILV